MLGVREIRRWSLKRLVDTARIGARWVFGIINRQSLLTSCKQIGIRPRRTTMRNIVQLRLETAKARRAVKAEKCLALSDQKGQAMCSPDVWTKLKRRGVNVIVICLIQLHSIKLWLKHKRRRAKRTSDEGCYQCIKRADVWHTSGDGGGISCNAANTRRHHRVERSK